jgi:hypothetical protein
MSNLSWVHYVGLSSPVLFLCIHRVKICCFTLSVETLRIHRVVILSRYMFYSGEAS